MTTERAKTIDLCGGAHDVDCTIGPEWVGVRVETAGVALWARHAIGLGANIRVPDGLLRAAIAEMLDEAREALALV